MITSPVFAGKTYGVYGLARSGLATVAALTASGATTLNWDDGEAARAKSGLPLTNLHEIDLATLDALIVSPGVPHSAQLFVKARDAGIPVIGDIEIFAQARATLPAAKVVGITGTNGKSTTTALVHHMLKSAGRPTLMGGNIGLPILAQDPLPAGGVYVLELSSYQLDITESLDCEVGVFLNLTPDHLERHGTMQGYAAAKARLFAMQSPGQTAVIDGKAEREYHILDVAEDPVIVFIEDVALGDQAEWPSLQGPHNRQNAAAAVAACAAVAGPRPGPSLLKKYPRRRHRPSRLRACAQRRDKRLAAAQLDHGRGWAPWRTPLR